MNKYTYKRRANGKREGRRENNREKERALKAGASEDGSGGGILRLRRRIKSAPLKGVPKKNEKKSH